MKIWRSHGSEHSMNLVMIGRFKDEFDAEESKEIIEMIAEHVMKAKDFDYNLDRFPKVLRDFLDAKNIFYLSPHQIVQFFMDFQIEQNGKEVRLTTQEEDLSGMQRIMLHKGAKIEIFSANDYPSSGK